jgi:hypothetical protein
VSSSGRDGLSRRVGEAALGYDSQAVSKRRRGEDSSSTRAPALCQSIKCSGWWSGYGSGEPARALERGGASPEGASDPRARRSLTRGGVWPSSEAEFRQYGAVSLERSGISPKGCWGRPFWWAAEVARAVGSCHQAVIAWGAICNMWVYSCFVICERKWVFSRLFRGPRGCPYRSATRGSWWPRGRGLASK